MSNPLIELHSFGQSVWLDQIERALFKTGKLAKLIKEDGLRGMTSNPTIFEKAITGSSDYQEQIDRAARDGKTGNEIYEEVVIDDIAHAADLFRPLYDSTNGEDGFVSLEVSPLLAKNTDGTIREAKTLFSRLNRPNVMIKVPATEEGLPAIEELIASGLNINVTLIFSVHRYEEVAEAYIRGLERRAQAGQPIDRIGSVASFFVSRIDSAVDKQLEALEKEATDPAKKQEIHALRGKAAIANAKLAYASFKRIFESPRFEALKRKGARVQRPLWASTSTKDPSYPDVLYVTELIGPHTVNTLPPATVDAWRDHGVAGAHLEKDMDKAPDVFAKLKALGIDFNKVTDKLTTDGVRSFSASFVDLMRAIEQRREMSLPGIKERHVSALGKYEGDVQAALQELGSKNVIQRFWNKEAAVWSADAGDQKIINNALGWLTVTDLMQGKVKELKAFAAEVQAAGFKHAVVLGMGGSSLCPEVLRQTFGKQLDYPELLVLDSTVPAAVLAIDKQIDPAKTLFIVASKSGSTTEPQMFYRYYFEKTKQVLGDKAGQNFVAITDPNTQLESEAKRDGFRKVFTNMADIGGRYSALSYFGMVPFTVMGGDVDSLLRRAKAAMDACAAGVEPANNAGAKIGAILGALARKGRDKVTFVTPPPISSLGLWIEQLIAESTGKHGKGIVPISGESLGDPKVYGDDRVFVYIGVSGTNGANYEAQLQALEQAGHPVLHHVLNSPIDLGEEFFLWEFATPIAGELIGINPFDQPNVQESKDNTKRILKEYTDTGKITQLPEVAEGDGLTVLTDENNRKALNGVSTPDSAITAHLGRVQKGDYFAITQYIEETPEIESLVQQIRTAVRDKACVATTTGYGPRFLHSTGQLHKGGPDSGVFLQLISNDAQDVPLPGEKFTFGVLKDAQALGDFESLSSRGRRAIRVNLGNNIVGGLKKILAAVQQFEGATAGAARK
ncbi:glucose-6-phosphate isomerase [Candidatus Koribacter versatilis Ellin345]|uniref:Transaldolase n=1 Tax=Koribacter versatilis (strain Ellin345) TaxID=204669 RepID=Q1IMT9_KORVE|nr:bifunctional transaldolase/phosoglucose isomerase [Candidatus Koribacter versatilis]ABF41811.1 glucose-6-phosphate isomerase [Candidatus Koribacter versatilis Ellin345]